MSARFHFRIERPAQGGYDGAHPLCIDGTTFAATLDSMRSKVEKYYSQFSQWDWRGAVAFVDGLKPAEECLVSKNSTVPNAKEQQSVTSTRVQNLMAWNPPTAHNAVALNHAIP